MKRIWVSILIAGLQGGTLFAKSPFPLPPPSRPGSFPLSVQRSSLLGDNVRTFGTILEWRQEVLSSSEDNEWYTALVALAPPDQLPKGTAHIVEGSAFSAAITTDGAVFTWGQNSFSYTLSLRSFLEGFTNTHQVHIAGSELAGSELAAAVLLNDGTVQQLGLDLPDGTPLPPPTDLSGVVQIAVGLNHIVALRSDGTVVTWGAIADGIAGSNQLYPDLPSYTYAPAHTLIPSNVSNVVQVAAAFHHAFALKSDGTVVGWGYRFASPWDLIPAYVPVGLTNVVQIATSEYITAALKADGTVSVWAFTNSVPSEYSFILPPSDLTNVVKVAVGNGHGLALINNGTVRSWGRYARPRDGAVEEISDPLVSRLPADSSAWTNIIDIAAGNESGYGLVWDGKPRIQPAITLATRGSEGFVLEWSDELNRAVKVQRRSSLSSGVWSNISINVMGPRFVDPSPPAESAFYRLVAP